MSEPTAPVRVEVIPGQLAVEVYLHEIASQHGAIACWTYVTDGLAVHGQTEIAFTLRHDPDEVSQRFPDDPLRLFATIHGLAATGQRVGAGGVTEFGEAMFLGHHLLYAAAQGMAGVALPAPCLAALLITADELRAVRAFGAARVLARLGQAAAFYPFPPWADRRRRGLALERTFESSLLSKIARAAAPNLHLMLHDGQITLRALRAEQPLWRDRLAQLPADAAVALLTSIDPTANGCLTWVPGQKAPEAIVPPGSDGSRMSGCFVVFVTGQPVNRGMILEDGFAIELTAEGWQAIRRALGEGDDLTLPAAAGGMAFALAWRDEIDLTPPDGERGTGAAAARAVRRVALGPVRLLISEAELVTRASADDVGRFCHEIQRCADRVLAGHDGQLELRLQVVCRPRSHRVGVSHRGELAEGQLDALIDALEQLATPPVRGEISFELELTLPAAGPGAGFSA